MFLTTAGSERGIEGREFQLDVRGCRILQPGPGRLGCVVGDDDGSAIGDLPGESTPEIDDLTVSVVAQSVYAQGDIPFSQAYVDDIDIFDDDLATPVSTPPLTSIVDVTQPEAQEEPDEGLVEWELTGVNDPNLSLFRIATFMNQTLWKIYVDGGATEFQFPEFPDFDQFDFGTDDGDPVEPIPYPGGIYTMYASGLVEPDQLDVDGFHYGQIYGDYATTNYSMDSLMIGLPSEWSEDSD